MSGGFYEGQTPLPAFPFNFILAGLGPMFISGLVASSWRRRIAMLRIGIGGGHEPVTVRFVNTSEAEGVFRALKG